MIKVIGVVLELLAKALAVFEEELGSALDFIREAAAKLLSLIPADQPLGTELFNGLCRLTVTFAFEVVIIREGKTGPEVYVTPRTADEAYSGLWHVPGTALRLGETFASAMTRLCAREGLHINQRPDSLQVVGILNHRKEERGHFISFIVLAEPLGDGMIGGKWISVFEADETLVPHHRLDIIPRGLTAWPYRENLPKLEDFASEDFHIYPEE